MTQLSGGSSVKSERGFHPPVSSSSPNLTKISRKFITDHSTFRWQKIVKSYGHLDSAQLDTISFHDSLPPAPLHSTYHVCVSVFRLLLVRPYKVKKTPLVLFLSLYYRSWWLRDGQARSWFEQFISLDRT